MELSQIDKGYLQQLIAYNKILNERNNLLKQINLYPALIETLDGWDEQLLTAGQCPKTQESRTVSHKKKRRICTIS